MRLCEIDGCQAPHKARGWCNLHWARWRRHGDPHSVLPPPGTPCTVDGCQSPRKARGLCQGHLARVYQYGHTVEQVPLGASYGQLQEALEEVAEHCVDCGDLPMPGGLLRCESCMRADLAKRTRAKAVADRGRPDPSRIGVRRVSSPTFTGRQGAA